jgi:glycosyltransferase involved in cell wall biosynthesis
MRRLLACCQVDHPGGAEIGLLRLARRLLERDWDVTVTTPGEGPVRDEAMAMGCGWTGIDCGGLAPGAGARAVGSWPKALWLSRDHDATLLNGTVAGRLLPALRGRRTLLHVHDMVTRVPRHWQGADVVLADSEAVAHRIADLDPVVRVPPFWRAADVVLADSNAVASLLGPLDAHVVYGPVEPDPPDVAPPWPTSEGPLIGFVGRIEPRKGPLDLVLAAPAIHAGAPGVRIVLVGDDPYGTDPAYAGRCVRGNTWSTTAGSTTPRG